MGSVLGNAMNSLAATYSDLGRGQDALVTHEKTLEFRRRVLPKNHPDLGISYYNISVSYSQVGGLIRAIEMAREALRIFQASLPPSHHHVQDASQHLLQLEHAAARRV